MIIGQQVTKEPCLNHSKKYINFKYHCSYWNYWKVITLLTWRTCYLDSAKRSSYLGRSVESLISRSSYLGGCSQFSIWLSWSWLGAFKMYLGRSFISRSSYLGGCSQFSNWLCWSRSWIVVGKTSWLEAFKIPTEARARRAILKNSNVMARMTSERLSKLLMPKRATSLDETSG